MSEGWEHAELRQVLLRFLRIGGRAIARPGWELREQHPRNRAALAHMFAAVWPLEAQVPISRRETPERRNGAPLGLHPVLQAAERLVLRCVTRADFCVSTSVVCRCFAATPCTRRECDAELDVLQPPLCHL